MKPGYHKSAEAESQDDPADPRPTRFADLPEAPEWLGRLDIVRVGLVLRRLSRLSDVPTATLWARFQVLCDVNDLADGTMQIAREERAQPRTHAAPRLQTLIGRARA